MIHCLGGRAHEIVTKTVHKTLPRVTFFSVENLSNLFQIYRSNLLPTLYV